MKKPERIYAMYGYYGRNKDNSYSTGHLTLDGVKTLCGRLIEGDWKANGHSWNKDCAKCEKAARRI